MNNKNDFGVFALFSVVSVLVLLVLTSLSILIYSRYLKDNKLDKIVKTVNTVKSLQDSSKTSMPNTAPLINRTSCFEYEIKGYGSLDSEKCYTYEVYNDLAEKFNKYKIEESRIKAYTRTVDSICTKEEVSLQATCTKYKDLLLSSQKNSESLKLEIEELISKGK